MSRKFAVYMQTMAFSRIVVEVDDDLDDIEARDVAMDKAYELTPDLCAHCSGWGQRAGVELGEWEIEDGDDAVSEVDE